METTEFEPGYPKAKYSATGGFRVVESPEAESKLPGQWGDSPAEFGFITAPSAEEMVPPLVPRPLPYAPNAWGPAPEAPPAQGTQHNP